MRVRVGKVSDFCEGGEGKKSEGDFCEGGEGEKS